MGVVDHRRALGGVKTFHDDFSLAMSLEDLKFIQEYFKDDEKRNPYETEIKVLDTYWSDHCRHTTFETEITNTNFSMDKITHQIENTFKDYLRTKDILGRTEKPVTLMDIATINTRLEKSQGNLNDLEISEEVSLTEVIELIRVGIEYNTNIKATIIIAPEITTLRPIHSPLLY